MFTLDDFGEAAHGVVRDDEDREEGAEAADGSAVAPLFFEGEFNGGGEDVDVFENSVHFPI